MEEDSLKEDFGFYGEVGEVQQEQIEKGISDKVTEFTYSNLDYPCIVFREDFSCPKHKLRAVSNMVKAKGVNKDINLYFTDKGELFKMGMLSGLQINPFLEIMGCDSVIGFYDAETKLEGGLLYTLYTIS